MINWELIETSINARIKSYSSRDESDFAKYLAKTYHYAMITSATNTRGNKLVRADKKILEKMWVNAFTIGKTSGSDKIKKKMMKLFNKGVYLYWSSAVFMPTESTPTNVVVNAGSPNVFIPYNTSDDNAFVENLINKSKRYVKTIIGTGWVGVI